MKVPQYTKSHYDINKFAITPIGPIPDIESGVERDISKLKVGHIDYPPVVEHEATLP
jgi:glutathionyl-hydroquinone reductase